MLRRSDGSPEERCRCSGGRVQSERLSEKRKCGTFLKGATCHPRKANGAPLEGEQTGFTIKLISKKQCNDRNNLPSTRFGKYL